MYCLHSLIPLDSSSPPILNCFIHIVSWFVPPQLSIRFIYHGVIANTIKLMQIVMVLIICASAFCFIVHYYDHTLALAGLHTVSSLFIHVHCSFSSLCCFIIHFLHIHCSYSLFTVIHG
jgi:hypothetical protein